MRIRFIICFLGMMMSFAASPAQADDLQNQLAAIARTMKTEGYAFRRTIDINTSGEPRRIIVQQYDPRKAAADRWTLVSIDGKAPDAKAVDQARKRQPGAPPAYAEIAKWIGGPATKITTTPGTVIYRFASLPKGTVMLGSHDASADSQAEAIVNIKGKVPFVERVRISSNKKFRMMLVASVQSIVITNSFTMLNDGHIVPADAGSIVAGSMMGRSGEMRSSASYSDFQAIK